MKLLPRATFCLLSLWIPAVFCGFHELVGNVSLDTVHLCGGNPQLSLGQWQGETTSSSPGAYDASIPNDLYTGVRRFKRKVEMIKRHVLSRVEQSQREYIQDFVGKPDCFNMMRVEEHSRDHISEAMSSQDVLENLRSDMVALKTSLGLLKLMENESIGQTRALTARMTRVRFDVQSVMCKLTRFMVILGADMTLEITPEVRLWCRADDECTRFQRDAVILTQIHQLANTLEQKYHFITENFVF